MFILFSLPPLTLAHLFEEVDEAVNRVVDSFRPVAGIGSLSVGQGCVARFTADGHWYRATVRKIEDGLAEVRKGLLLSRFYSLSLSFHYWLFFFFLSLTLPPISLGALC